MKFTLGDEFIFSTLKFVVDVLSNLGLVLDLPIISAPHYQYWIFIHHHGDSRLSGCHDIDSNSDSTLSSTQT
jgi:hypothetical protein